DKAGPMFSFTCLQGRRQVGTGWGRCPPPPEILKSYKIIKKESVDHYHTFLILHISLPLPPLGSRLATALPACPHVLYMVHILEPSDLAYPQEMKNSKMTSARVVLATYLSLQEATQFQFNRDPIC
ncbi:hypothetical protein J6590_095243, partial [Homalodisca vitripennis]